MDGKCIILGGGGNAKCDTISNKNKNSRIKIPAFISIYLRCLPPNKMLVDEERSTVHVGECVLRDEGES